MDAKDIEIVKSIMEAAIKAAFQAQDVGVPMAWCAAIGSALVSAVLALWGWGFKQSNAWAVKIGELSIGQRTGDDERESTIRERLEGVIAQLNSDHRDAVVAFERRIERLEAAKDLARDQYNGYRKETELWAREQLIEVTKALEEAAEVSEAAVSELERRG